MAILPRESSRFFFPFGGEGRGRESVVVVVEVATAVGVTTFHTRVASTNGARSVWPMYAVETMADPLLVSYPGAAAGKTVVAEPPMACLRRSRARIVS